MPGRPSLDIEVGAEAQRVNGRIDDVFDGPEAAEMMTETTFLATSEKLWFPPDSTFGGPLSSEEKFAAKKARSRRGLPWYRGRRGRPPGRPCEW